MLHVEAFERDLPQVEVAANVEAADHVADRDVDDGLVFRAPFVARVETRRLVDDHLRLVDGSGWTRRA